MKREVVQNFLNLPGIAGIALMDGRSRPYFYGVDQTLNFQQKEALAQGIQQVVETTPTGFAFYEFHFAGHQIYIYKLDHGIILLVLAKNELIYSDYRQAIKKLKVELQEDAANAIATFRLLAGNVTLSNQNYWKRREGTTTSNSSLQNQGSKTNSSVPAQGDRNGTQQIPPKADADAPAPTPPPSTETPSTPDPGTSIKIKELIDGMNHFSQFTTQYLGPTVVTNYWKSTRPAIDWLNNFQIDRSAQITFSGSGNSASNYLTAEQHQWVKEWVEVFIQRCSKVIRDFPTLIEQRALDDRQKALLLSDKS